MCRSLASRRRIRSSARACQLLEISSYKSSNEYASFVLMFLNMLLLTVLVPFVSYYTYGYNMRSVLLML